MDGILIGWSGVYYLNWLHHIKQTVARWIRGGGGDKREGEGERCIFSDLLCFVAIQSAPVVSKSALTLAQMILNEATMLLVSTCVVWSTYICMKSQPVVGYSTLGIWLPFTAQLLLVYPFVYAVTSVQSILGFNIQFLPYMVVFVVQTTTTWHYDVYKKINLYYDFSHSDC